MSDRAFCSALTYRRPGVSLWQLDGSRDPRTALPCQSAAPRTVASMAATAVSRCGRTTKPRWPIGKDC